jgi:GNAT superfamily N-acetyltransferase
LVRWLKKAHLTQERHNLSTKQTFKIFQVDVSDIIDLRHRILRHGQSLESARFPQDNNPLTLHLATFSVNGAGEKIGAAACCVTFIPSEHKGDFAYQLRGMVTDLRYQGCGLGKDILKFAEIAIRNTHPSGIGLTVLWCHARVSAVGFYEKQDWSAISEEIDIPNCGMHRIMLKTI